MKLSELSLVELGKVVNMDDSVEYRSGPQIVELFNFIGINEDYWELNAKHEFGSRANYTIRKLSEINGTLQLKIFIEILVDDRQAKDSESTAILINKIIKHDGYLLEKNAEGILKITGKDLPENIVVTAVFEDIEKQVIQHINSAKYSIWVAVAWITSRPILDALYKQHLNGLNVRIVVNDDETTAKYGLPIEKTHIEYYKISPRNDDFKNTMHHKFCVIDLKKVVTGSFNWTMKASFNNENIAVIEQREKAEMYADEFLKLIAPFKGKRKGH